MATFSMNGSAMNSTQSLNGEDSEESFVVLSPSLAPDNMETIMSVNSSMVNSLNNMSHITTTSKQLSEAISAMSVSATSELSPDEIHSKLESLLQENLQLKETLHQNNLAMKKQFTTLVAWQEDVMKVHQSHKEKFEETKKLISNLRAENMELKKGVSLPTVTLPTANSSDNEKEKLSLKSKIAALEFELDTLRQGYMKYQTEQSSKIEELQTQLVNTTIEKDEKITVLTTQVENLKTELTNSQARLDVAQKRILEMAEKIPTISSKETIEKLNKEITELTAELEYKNKIVIDKTELVDKLSKQNKDLEVENQTIFIYKTQVEQYQKDFNEERSQRNIIHEEKERIAEDLRNLHRRNEELMIQVEQYHKDGFVNIPTASNIQSHERTPSPPLFRCPLCNNTFRTYRLLEQHCEHCVI